MRAEVALTDQMGPLAGNSRRLVSLLNIVPTTILLTLVALSALATAVPTTASAAGIIEVKLDQATIRKVNPLTATLVVGNPLIADVSVQAGGVMVVTGKGYGVTNLIALDRDGNVLAKEIVEVASPVDVVVVYRGVTRESYSCTPHCERRITLGDSPEYFATTLGETGDRNRTAQTGQGNGNGR
jgi:hypothetical protein